MIWLTSSHAWSHDSRTIRARTSGSGTGVSLVRYRHGAGVGSNATRNSVPHHALVANPGLPPGVSFSLKCPATNHISCTRTLLGTLGDIEAAVNNACARTRVRCIRLAAVADHVHLLISYHPTTRISDFIRLCKSGASYRAGRRVPGAIKWCRGYHVSSVGKRELHRVEVYIANQHTHHSDLIPKAR